MRFAVLILPCVTISVSGLRWEVASPNARIGPVRIGVSVYRPSRVKTWFGFHWQATA